jgi:hypothetical protein
MSGSSVIAQAGRVVTDGKTPAPGPTLFGVRLTSQLVLLALSTVALAALIGFALFDWAGRS